MLARLLLLLALAARAAEPVDLNAASPRELEALPGIGPAKAAAIVEHRDLFGPFRAIEELDHVDGIGMATIRGLRGRITVATPVDAAGGAARGPGRVNVNRASATELEALPGVGAAKARTIVEDRAVNGPFASCAELVRVVGIGPATLASIADRCVAD